MLAHMSTPDDDPETPRLVLLMLEIAQRHYSDGQTLVAIAADLELSRFKVARLLTEARKRGFVQISFREPEGYDFAGAQALKARWGLRRAIVVAPRDETDWSTARTEMASAAAQLIMETVAVEDTLGLVWGKIVNHAARQITRLPACTLVQMTGVDATGSMDDSPIASLQHVASISRGKAFPIYSPMLLKNARLVGELRDQPGIAAACARFDDVTHALIAVGSWQQGHSALHDACNPAEKDELRSRGAVAEICGHLFNARGHVIADDFSRRCLGIGLDQLSNIPNLTAVAGGRLRIPAIHSALRAGLIRTLVTDSFTARALAQLPL